MTNVKRLGHVALIVADIDRSIDFYTSMLGFKVSDRLDGEMGEHFARGAWLRCDSDTDHHCLAMFERADGELPIAGASMHHLAFEVGSLEELLAVHDELLAADVKIAAMRHLGPGCQVRLYCLDPDGHRVELYWGLDKIGWQETARPFPPIEDIDLANYDVSRLLEHKRATREEAGVR